MKNIKYRVRCTNCNGGCHTIGKIYNIYESGAFETDKYDFPGEYNHTSVEMLNKYYSSQFELFEDKFTPKNLKAGMLVECANGDLYMVMPYGNNPDRICIVKENGVWSAIGKYDDIENGYNITKVYGFCGLASKSMEFSNNHRRLLWEKKVITPCLQNNKCESYGVVGTNTILFDVCGENLCVGDVVSVYDTERKDISNSFVIEYNGSVGIMELLSASTNMKCGRVDWCGGSWNIKKVKSHTDLKDGETYDGIFFRKIGIK